MVLMYARTQRGQRAYGKQPKVAARVSPLLGVVSLQAGFLEGMSFTGDLKGVGYRNGFVSSAVA